jgi:hypothetical protein
MKLVLTLSFGCSYIISLILMATTSIQMIDCIHDMYYFSDFRMITSEKIFQTITVGKNSSVSITYYCFQNKKRIQILTTDTKLIPDNYMDETQNNFNNVPLFYSAKCRNAYYVKAFSTWGLKSIFDSVSGAFYSVFITMSITIIGFIVLKNNISNKE